MEELNFRKTFEKYREVNARSVEWLIGLQIGELALILSQHFYTKGPIFYLFLLFSFSSILVAILIMYAVISYADIELQIIFLGQKKPSIPEEKLWEEIPKLSGKVAWRLLDEIVTGKVYRLLFCCFFLITIMMIVSIVRNI